MQEAGKPQNYANLLFACDTGDPKLGAFMQKQMEKGSELSVLILFFELELQSTPQATIDRIIGDPSLRAILKKRETEVLQWISNGKSTWEISKLVGISEHGVVHHVRNVLTKFDVASRHQAVAKAVAHGLL